MSEPSKTAELQAAIKNFLHHMDAGAWIDNGQPNYPSDTWPYSLLTDALRNSGDEYVRKKG